MQIFIHSPTKSVFNFFLLVIFVVQLASIHFVPAKKACIGMRTGRDASFAESQGHVCSTYFAQIGSKNHSHSSVGLDGQGSSEITYRRRLNMIGQKTITSFFSPVGKKRTFAEQNDTGDKESKGAVSILIPNNRQGK